MRRQVFPASSLRNNPPLSASTIAYTRSGLAETATPILPSRLGSPSVRRVQVSPPSVDFQIPLPVPPLRTIHGTRWWSHIAAYRMRGFDGSIERSLAPLVGV